MLGRQGGERKGVRYLKNVAPRPTALRLPRSFNIGPSCLNEDRDGDHEFKELVETVDLDAVLLQIRKNRSGLGSGARVLPKSCSVKMGRTEEERECHVGGESEKASRGSKAMRF